MKWINTINIKHLFTEKEDYDSVQKSMNEIADVLSANTFFKMDLRKFREIPKGDKVFGPVDYANKLLEKMYDYADKNRIWID